MNHAPGAGSLARPVDQQASALPLCYGRPHSPLHVSKYICVNYFNVLLITYERVDVLGHDSSLKGYNVAYRDQRDQMR